MGAIKGGLRELGGLGLWVMVRSISRVFFQNSVSTIFDGWAVIEWEVLPQASGSRGC